MVISVRLKKWFGYSLLVAGSTSFGYLLGSNMEQSQKTQPDVATNESYTTQSDAEHWITLAEAPKNNTTKTVEKAALDVNSTIDAIIAQSSQFKQFAATYPVAMRATGPQLESLIERLLQLEASVPASIGIARIFYVRYINLNPQAAAEHFWANMPSTSSQYRRVMFNLYHEWAWLDMPATLANVTENVIEEHREEIITFLLRDDHFTQDSALAELAANYSEHTRAEAMLARVSRQSNEAAFEQLISMPRNSEARRSGLFRLIRRWATEDPQGALARLKSLGQSADRHNLIANVIGIWAQTDPEQALLAALNIADGNNYAYSALSVLAKNDGVRALELTKQYQDRLEHSVMSQVMQTWASSDPQGAAAYIEQLGGNQVVKNARQIAWHYALQYPEEAYRWAERVGLLEDSNLASNMGNALVQNDLNKAQEIYALLPPSASRDGLFANIVRQRSKIDIAQTYKWLSDYTDEPKYSEVRNNLLYEWSRRDPQASAEVIMSIEDNPNRSAHLSSVANNWYDRAPEQALRWLYGLPTGVTRDRTIASLAHKIGRSDVDEALRIAAEISDEQFRQNLYQQLNSQKR